MSSNKIVLTSSDGESFEIEKAVGHKLKIVSHMIDDNCVNQPIPLQNVTGDILAKVIEYCKRHADDGSTDEAAVEDDEAKKKMNNDDWDVEFMKNIDPDETLFELIFAANYLNVKGLLDLACQTVADQIKNMTPKEVRKVFNIENDFTPEEEEEMRQENQWAYEKDT